MQKSSNFPHLIKLKTGIIINVNNIIRINGTFLFTTNNSNFTLSKDESKELEEFLFPTQINDHLG